MERAKQLRRRQTDAEQRLWRAVRGSQLGVRFRRQHPMIGYIVDFVCIERRLIVELDGGQHADNLAYDEQRSRALETQGFRVLRFWNDDVLQRTDDVLQTIHAVLNETPQQEPNASSRRYRAKAGRSAKAGDSPVRWHEAIALRARLYRTIREFFAVRGVLEVETPILSAAANTDPNIESFATRFSGHERAGSPQRWLRTSSEFAQKRLLAAGVGDCYELGRVFRNGEAGGRHNPEFTMLEWYRLGWDHQRLIGEVVELVDAALALVGRNATTVKMSYRDLFLQTVDVDPFTASEEQLRAAVGEVRVDGARLTRDDWLDLVLTHRIQPNFPAERITVVYDYPASQCALAKIRPGDPPLTERFELYLGTQELANGYHELTDAAEQRTRFERDNARRRARGDASLPFDENLLAVLDGLPDCAGVALGVERLLMAMIRTDAIADVLAFVFAEA